MSKSTTPTQESIGAQVPDISPEYDGRLPDWEVFNAAQSFAEDTVHAHTEVEN